MDHQDLLSALSYENLIKDSGSRKLYKGRLKKYFDDFKYIVAWWLDGENGQGYNEFKTEISMLSRLKHRNISSILEYDDQDNKKIIIYNEAFHGILDQHLCDTATLTWSRRLQICLGVARALEYINYDVIHCDINTSKIFLDKEWEPRIFGFELSTKYPQSWRHRLQFSRYFDSKTTITPKYDVYGYGVLLFEVLCGKKLLIEDNYVKDEPYDILDLNLKKQMETQSLTLFLKVAYNYLNQQLVEHPMIEEIIDPNLKKQMDTQSLTLFLKIAYNCLKQQPVERPTMEQVVKELEEALELQREHETLGNLGDSDESISSNHLKMDYMKIPLSEIRSATNNFDEENVVGYGGFGKVYRAKLDVADTQSLSSTEGGNYKDGISKKSKTVAIKRIFKRPDEQGKEGFIREIQLLTSCKHPNIVSLIGFSREDSEMILVYEYAFKGVFGKHR